MFRVIMWCFVLCLAVGLNEVRGSIVEEMAKITEQCCGQGTAYARNHTSDDCSSSIPPTVPTQFGTLCIFAMDQCCKEYFQKKRDCDSGVQIATSSQSCSAATEPTKNCCAECSLGAAAGDAGESCGRDARGGSAEELLAVEAFTQCCQKAAEGKADAKPKSGGTPVVLSRSSSTAGSTVASLCEEYAPNELCAHHCIPVPGSYKCECNPGFMLMADGRNCIEVEKDRCKPRNPCQHKCNDNGVEVKCSCRRGYQLKADGKSCEDIDECQTEPAVCLSNTQCFNIQGSYKCIPLKKNTPNAEKGQCPPGFARNIKNNACDDINECSLLYPPCPAYLCENTIGGYKCGGVTGDPSKLPKVNKPPPDDRCPPGFRIGYDEECEDVDECSLKRDDCNPLSQFCINTRGAFYCQNKASKHCPPGFKIDAATNKCQDIDECEEDICRPDQVCVNLPGAYDCKLKQDIRKKIPGECPDGMRIKPGSTVCEDIDECVEGTHLCDQYQSCLNTNGSHECRCKLGFELDPITGACTDVNECATDQHNCIPSSQRCDNTVGSFLCVRFAPCGTGYILHHTTSECEDIDECALGIHNCDRAGPAYHCVNYPGSFRCEKQRTTTSSTTLPPSEYEYYYDSEEEEEGNQTQPEQPVNNQPVTTTSEPKPSPTQTSSTKTPETPRIPDFDVRFNPEEKHEPVTFVLPSTTPEPPRPTEPPRPRATEPPIPRPTDPPIPRPTEPPVPLPTDPPRPRPTEPPIEVTELEIRPTEPPYPNQRSEEPTNETIPPETERPEPTNRPNVSPTPPHVVLVEVGKETATVDGEKRNDGSVVLNTKDLPENEWTKVNVKPSNCQIGFENDERGLCVDIDECSTGRHSCSGLTEQCRNTIGGYLCDCAPGFRRDVITKVCDVITASSTSSSLPTLPSTLPPTTTERSKSFFWGYPDYRQQTVRPFRPRNMCDVGFRYNAKNKECEDINECVNGQANCASVEICVNTQGGYRCECPPNWRLDEVRHRCVPIRNTGQFPAGYGNENSYSITPQSPEDVKQIFKGPQYVEPEVTHVEDRGTVFTCPRGYKLGYDGTCEDIDECATGQAYCENMLICTNLPGGYVCSCPPGHKLIPEKNRCEDVDECALGGNMPVCSQNADCVNTVGSYQCRCHTGFRSAPVNDKVCVDVDECSESSAGSLCQHRCNNVWGTYRCSCHRGYRLNPDNSTCSDVDECTEYKSKVVCIGRCVNEPGSYRCTCPQGYRLSEDKRSCIDIDECETGEAPCSKGGTYAGSSDVCLNTRGGYRCHRITCLPGYKLENRHRCTRIEKVCPPADWECAHQPTTYSYNFITFVSKLHIPSSKVDLFTMKGPSWPNANMRFQLRLVDVNVPPSVKKLADINAFLLVQTGNQAVMSLVRSLDGPQSIELELSMELYNGDQFGGIAVAKIYIYVSEYEF